MEEGLRQTLYPLGFIGAFLFAGRFLFQWVESEWKKKSVVSPTFWKISLAGNVSMLLHVLFQGQFLIVLLQTISGVISWRNLNLHKPAEKHVSLRRVFSLFALTTIFISFLFIFVQWYFDGNQWQWYRIPKTPWTKEVASVGGLWDMTGLFGYAMFCSRFWFQWWGAERRQQSYVGPLFWWYSLLGGFLTTIYFAKIGDWVQFVGPGLGLIPYMRNLVFLRKKVRPSS